MKTENFKLKNNILFFNGNLLYETVKNIKIEIDKFSNELFSKKITIDLKKVTKIDTAGLALLLYFKKKVNSLKFQNCNKQIENSFKLVDLSNE